MATAPQEQAIKAPKRRTKHTREALPKVGFVYKEGVKMFQREQDSAAFKQALQQVSSNLHKIEVDEALAELFTKAKELKKQGSIQLAPTFEAAGKAIPWSSSLDEHIVVEAMSFLRGARELHIKFTTYRAFPQNHITEGKLAKAIDTFTDIYPAKEPDESFKRMDPKMIDGMMDKMRKGQKANWDEMPDDAGDSDVDMVGNKSTDKGTKDLAALLKAVSMK
ncbi:Uu.00g096090.m01.CDS01 [Anthostomella pinea]|uniref:Uu.00g096090.m01.CDS01 n=1 Tax=Anthostomella pinea TaxID=933095 RepID=A0AAI8YEW6_9PEZI|nr:Uu.00g096090.m01.CDS01 [Anthostomella pinea]